MPPPCPACERPSPASWTFRRDDLHCPLCGREILRLRLGQEDPEGQVWLYQGETSPVITMTWLRSQGSGSVKLAPWVDLASSRAQFHSEETDRLDFNLRPAPDPDPKARAHIVAASLAPRANGHHPGPRPAIPTAGVAGLLTLACSFGDRQVKALLLPRPDRFLRLSCDSPGIIFRDGVWEVYQREPALVVPMTVESSVPAWVLRAEVAPVVEVRGLDKPIRLEPGRPHRFEIVVHSENWPASVPIPIVFRWTFAGGIVESFAEMFVARSGRRLIFDPTTLKVERLYIGQKIRRHFDLKATAGDDAIEIRDFQVSTEDGKPWLGVVRPDRKFLPWQIAAAGEVAPKPTELLLEVDTSGLDRQQYDGKEVIGKVELLDARQLCWTGSIRVNLSRATELKSDVALDWGTTNTCAAFARIVGEGFASETLELAESVAGSSPESFPSDVYFKDLSKPERPAIWIGNKAKVEGKISAECYLRSVKRKLQFRETVFVSDEKGNGHVYPVSDVVLFLLHELINQIEARRGVEITRLGLTFPTKWSPKARQRLADVAARLRDRLAVERRPLEVSVFPPEIDEANAVAINLINSDHGRDLGDEFHLIAYDFGGGTVDTSVLKVRFDRQTGELSTRYIGIGGRDDLGGDDATRAVMMLLHSRLVQALARRSPSATGGRAGSRPVEIPLIADGEPSRIAGDDDTLAYSGGRKNWNKLWDIADQIKIRLSDASRNARGAGPAPVASQAPTGGVDDGGIDDEPAPAGPAPAAEWAAGVLDPATSGDIIRGLLIPNLGEISCRVASAQGGTTIKPLSDVLTFTSTDQTEAFARELAFGLDEAWDFPLEDVDRTNDGQTFRFRDRVTDTVEELRWQCEQAGVLPQIIILAGGSSRLPLVAELFDSHLVAPLFAGHPNPPASADLLYFNSAIAKQQVAHGLAKYLAFLADPPFPMRLAKSIDVIHRQLGVNTSEYKSGRVLIAFRPILPIGTPVDDPTTWHEFPLSPSQIKKGPEGRPILPVLLRSWRRRASSFQVPAPSAGGTASIDPYPRIETTQFGHFDLSRPEPVVEPRFGEIKAGLPPDRPAGECVGRVRLRGAGRIELLIEAGGTTYGAFPLVPTARDPESDLRS